MKFPARYSISDLEKLSGIKAHTLRIWEKRYGIFSPARTDTNIRYYSNNDLRHVLNVSQLNRFGIKISKIAAMSQREIEQKITELSIVHTGHQDVIDTLIVAMIDLDEAAFGKTFTDSVLRIGFENTIEQVIFPFFRRIGVMWQSGGINPAQEHFMTNIVRQKLVVAIDGTTHPDGTANGTVILFLPENELHELSLLYYHYILRKHGYKTVYLGQAVPRTSLLRVAEIIKADYLLSVLTAPMSAREVDSFIAFLKKLPVKGSVLLSGPVFSEHNPKLPNSILLFRDAAALLETIT